MARRSPARTRRRDAAAEIEALLSGRKAPQTAADAGPLKHFTPDEHIAWVEANCYRLTKGGGWAPLVYTTWQTAAIRALFAVTGEGTLAHATAVPCFPRRCGKSELAGLYDLHRADAYPDQLIVVQANSEDQAEDTVFRRIADTIHNSPRLAEREAVGEIEVLADQVRFHHTGSVCKLQPAREASTYGQGISVYHNTEGCKAADDATYQVGASSTGDVWCGLSIADSNMGDAANFIHRLVTLALDARAEAERAAAEGRDPDPLVGDPSIAAVWIRFEGLEDCLKRGCGVGLGPGVEPIHPWLSPEWIRGRYAQMVRSEFLRNHCNLPAGVGQALWTEEQVAPLFVDGIPRIVLPERVEAALGTPGGRMAVGVGLDRASATAADPDRTVLAATGRVVVPALKGRPIPVYDEKGEVIDSAVTDGSLYLLLGAWELRFRLADPLKEKLLEIDRLWGIGRAALEAYQASDLAEWCGGQRFAGRAEVRHLTTQAKVQLVEFFHGLIVTRRFRASRGYAVLKAELTNYRETAAGAYPSYEGRRRTVELDFVGPAGEVIRRRTRIKDDYLEAVLWSVGAARDARVRGRASLVAKPAGW